MFDSTLKETFPISQQLNLIIRGSTLIDIISWNGNIPRKESCLNNQGTEFKEWRIYGQGDTFKKVSGHLPTWIMVQNVNKQDRLEQLQKVVKTLLAFPLASTRKFHKFYLKGRGFCEFTTKKYI